MKLLLCCPLVLNKKFGGSKVYMEMAEAYERIGMDCTILSPNDLGNHKKITELSIEEKFNVYPEVLKEYLIENAGHYDVIEYEHEYLPYDRSTFSNNTLMVARSVLLVQHLRTIRIPRPKSMRAMVGNILFGGKRASFLNKRIDFANNTFHNADIINVTNPDDKKQLIEDGHSEDKIFHFPYGISQERLDEFSTTKPDIPSKKTIAFVGSFDYRKGALEFPQIVHEVLNEIPDAHFLLLGTKGMFVDEQSVRNFFPERYQSHLTVLPQFEPAKLPELLKDTTVGIFPSHLESFGFGILEMLAAHIPVVAYHVPGPPLMLDSDMLAPRGNGYKLAERIIQLLKDDELLFNKRSEARRIATSDQFNWNKIAERTIDCYKKARV